ncbi:putative non-specific serine/threonine protein kinase [Dioscorea sansibarensis]
MKCHGLLFVVILFVHSNVGEAQGNALFIDCGSNSSTNADGRKWIGDISPVENFTLTYPGIVAFIDTVDGELTYGSLYRTARFFNATSTYKISVFPGTYFVRLHFFPFSFRSFNFNESAFDVSANSLKLVSAFDVPGEISWKNTRTMSKFSSLIKEYFLNISSNQLEIVFVPKSGFFAFVNAIEIVPVIDQLFVDTVSRVGGNGLKTDLNLAERGMETMFRLNVGVSASDSSEDKLMWGKWQSDETYMFSVNAASILSNRSSISYSNNDSFVAPLLVYETARIMTDNGVAEKRFNMSWKFDVDPNFDYLIRLHFCEFICDKPNQRLFKIYINNKTAAEDYDVFAQAGGINKAYHQDYMDSVSQQTDTLWVQLGPDPLTGSPSTDAFLNGMEIFKLSRNGDLAHASSRITIDQPGSAGSRPKNKILWVSIGSERKWQFL